MNKKNCQTADCIFASSSWIQLLINETTMELVNLLWKTLAVYYSVTKSDKKQCMQKNMDFVDGHSTP